MQIFGYEIDNDAILEAVGGGLLAILGVFAYGQSKSDEGKAASALLALHGAFYAGEGVSKAISSAKPVQQSAPAPSNTFLELCSSVQTQQANLLPDSTR